MRSWVFGAVITGTDGRWVGAKPLLDFEAASSREHRTGSVVRSWDALRRVNSGQSARRGDAETCSPLLRGPTLKRVSGGLS
jgi:hypothetical protein